MGKQWQQVFTVLCISWTVLAQGSPPEDTRKSAGMPLSVEALLNISTAKSVNVSPDGTWVAYQVAEGGMRGVQHIHLQETASGRSIELGVPGTETSAPAWSPDSRRLAYASRTKTLTELWVWERATGESRRLATVEMAQAHWFSDSRRLLAALRMEDQPRASGQIGQSAAVPPESVAASEASVRVHRFDPRQPSSPGTSTLSGDTKPLIPPADLSVIDLKTGRVERLAHNVTLMLFRHPSPNDRYVAYAQWTGRARDIQLDTHDLHVIELRSGDNRLIARGLRSSGGRDFSWSPDSRFIAHLELRAHHEGEGRRDKASPADLQIISMENGKATPLGGTDLPVLYGVERPVWDSQSRKLYVLSLDRELWEVDVHTGRSREIVAPDNRRIVQLIRPDDSPMLWTPDGTEQIYVQAEDPITMRAGLYTRNLRTGAWQALIPERSIQDDLADASTTGGAIAFVSASQRSPGDVWLWTASAKSARKITTLNPRLEASSLAEGRRIEWQTRNGETLAGALLLPADYRPGEKRPLFVWVYGGKRGSQDLNLFGFTHTVGGMDNMQMWASRGYAVLHPDIPQHMGTPMSDIVTAVMPAVDMLVAQGYADPDRLAVGGHSYGSYTTLSLITHTSRFKAAIISGVTDPNLFANYLQMKSNGNDSQVWAEGGQGLMGGTPWQYPERYRDNSPAFLFDRVRTPLLMGQGELDRATPVTGANTVFTALRRLGQSVEYRIYAGEGHAIQSPANVADWWGRRLEFISEHLNIQVDGSGRVIVENGRAKAR